MRHSVIRLKFSKSAVPERIHTYPMEGHQKFLGGGGSLKQGMKLNWNFLGVSRVQNKNPPFCGGVWIYINSTMQVLKFVGAIRKMICTAAYKSMVLLGALHLFCAVLLKITISCRLFMHVCRTN